MFSCKNGPAVTPELPDGAADNDPLNSNGKANSEMFLFAPTSPPRFRLVTGRRITEVLYPPPDPNSVLDENADVILRQQLFRIRFQMEGEGYWVHSLPQDSFKG